MNSNLRETDLDRPLVSYLENQGYRVHREVQECDIVAQKGEEWIIVELKRRITVTLLTQAVRRKGITPSVYIAVPVPEGKRTIPNFGGISQLLKRLEVGLILVNFMKTKIKVDVMHHPLTFFPRRRPSKKRAIIREINGRYGEFNTAGSPVSEERITAYKQEAIRIAYYLAHREKGSPKELREWGTGPKTQLILSRNVYGWFYRLTRGIYTLEPAGKEALEKYTPLLPELRIPPLP